MEPVTWDSSGNMVPLTEEEAERQRAAAHEGWVASGNWDAPAPEVIATSWDTGFWMVVRDLGELGIQAVKFARLDSAIEFFSPTPGGILLGVILCLAAFAIGIALFPLTLVLHFGGRAGYEWSLQRAASR